MVQHDPLFSFLVPFKQNALNLSSPSLKVLHIYLGLLLWKVRTGRMYLVWAAFVKVACNNEVWYNTDLLEGYK